MSKGVTYGTYLRLPELLAAQRPQTGEHDELLFVILHQTMELWMKQAIHELGAAQAEVRSGNLVPCVQTPSARLSYPGGDDANLGHPRDDDAGGLSQLPQLCSARVRASSQRNFACSNTSWASRTTASSSFTTKAAKIARCSKRRSMRPAFMTMRCANWRKSSTFRSRPTSARTGCKPYEPSEVVRERVARSVPRHHEILGALSRSLRN